jgi:hypothetical protein
MGDERAWKSKYFPTVGFGGGRGRAWRGDSGGGGVVADGAAEVAAAVGEDDNHWAFDRAMARAGSAAGRGGVQAGG